MSKKIDPKTFDKYFSANDDDKNYDSKSSSAILKQNTELFSNPKKKFLDNSCGDGQFLSEIVIKKMEKSGCTLEQALKTAYGVDLMEDNIIECKKRLAGPNPTKKILNIINKNIVCENALTYDYSFKKSKITKPPQTHNLRPPLEHPYRSL